MSNQIMGYKGIEELRPSMDISQNANQQVIYRMNFSYPLTLLGGQSFLLPTGTWTVILGRYTHLQMYDTTRGLWRALPTQPGQPATVPSDGSNYRIANTTGTPVGAVINHGGAGNATNGYNTVGVTPSAGNSTWGTLVGGSLNTTITLGTTTGANGNFSLAPLILWTPAANQSTPYMPPVFTSTLSGSALGSIVVANPGAGLTGAGTLTAVQQLGDTAPGGANLTGVMNATLTNSGNLTAMWPLTNGTPQTAVPTFTFNIGGNMAANAIMNFTVTGMSDGTGACTGGNFGNSKRVMVLTANGKLSPWGGGGNANTTMNLNVASDYDMGIGMPRMAWISANSNATGNFSNSNLTIIDGGLNLQAIPDLVVIAGNNSASFGCLPVIVANVGATTDTSYVQMI